MEKKQKIFIGTICIIVAIIILTLIVCIVTKTVEQSENKNRLANMYEKMIQNQEYSITFKLNENNRYTVSRKGDIANIDTYSNGSHTTNIVKDGNTYLLMYNTKKYYIYQNNVTGIGEITTQLKEIIESQESEKGQEKIDNKNYHYEEYKGVSSFFMNANDENVLDNDTNTRFYFDGNNLRYIKTTMGDKTELISVEVFYDVVDNIFEIPSDFQKG